MSTSLTFIWFGPIIFALCFPFVCAYVKLMLEKNAEDSIRIKDIFTVLGNQDKFNVDIYMLFLMFSVVPILGFVIDIILISIIILCIIEETKTYKSIKTGCKYIKTIILFPFKYTLKLIGNMVCGIFRFIGNIRIG